MSQINRKDIMSDSMRDTLEWVNQKTQEAMERLKEKQSHLSPVKHPQRDFFIADIFDAVTFRSDIASMEYPIFALKAGDTRTRRYEHNGVTTTITASMEHGLATIHDKDIWIYCVSKLMQAMYEGNEINKIIRFTIYDYLITTNRHINGTDYERTKCALDRLSGTRIKIETENERERRAKSFGLIESWEVVEKKDGRMVRVEVTLPDWLYLSVTNKKVLSISHDYFRLRKPLDRRIYELTRKHCGKQKEWRISLELLHKKTGSTAPLRNFKIAIRSLAESNELPDYFVQFDVKTDMIIFKNRNTKAYIKDLFDGNH